MSQGRAFAPESALLTAALAGLLGGCGTKEKEKIVTVEPVGAVISTTVDKDITLASFMTTCETRGGLVQTHASCAGANTCAGLSYHSSSGKLSEHTCKATNICAGMSCVDLPNDGGLSGQAILEGTENGSMVGSETQCNFCHGEGKTSFVLPTDPDIDAATALLAFQNKTDAEWVVAIAFGLHGVKNGNAYSNMPGFYKSYSLAEIKRVVTHIRSLPQEAKPWTDPE